MLQVTQQHTLGRVHLNPGAPWPGTPSLPPASPTEKPRERVWRVGLRPREMRDHWGEDLGWPLCGSCPSCPQKDTHLSTAA